jgi:hypothetical protein
MLFNGRAVAYYAQGPGFNPQFPPPKKEKWFCLKCSSMDLDLSFQSKGNGMELAHSSKLPARQ